MMGWGNMMGGYGPGYYGAGNNWWMMGIGMAFQFIFWIAVIAIVWRFVSRHGSDYPAGHSSKDNALEILRERFAKGEIDSEEYKSRKEKLIQ